MNDGEEDHDERPLIASPNRSMMHLSEGETPSPAAPAGYGSRSSASSKITAILELLERKPASTLTTATTTTPTTRKLSEASTEAHVIDQAEARLASMKRTNDVPVLDDDEKFLERLLKFEQKSDAERLASVHLLKHSGTLPIASSSRMPIGNTPSPTKPIDNRLSPSKQIPLPYPTVQTRMISDLSFPSVHSMDLDPALDLTSLTDITTVASRPTTPPPPSHRNFTSRQQQHQQHHQHQHQQQQRRAAPPSSSSRSFLYGSTYHDPRTRVTTTATTPRTSSATATAASASRNVHVTVRVRPFTTAEQNMSSRRVVSYHDNKIVIVNPQGTVLSHPILTLLWTIFLMNSGLLFANPTQHPPYPTITLSQTNLDQTNFNLNHLHCP